MATTYTSLIDQIKLYANRTDAYFISGIPYFISMAQDRIWREAKDIGYQNTVSGTFLINNAVVNKPADWNQTISFSYGSGTPAPATPFTNNVLLFYRTYEFCTTYWPSAATASAPPLFYADSAQSVAGGGSYGSFFLAPTPDLAYSYQLVYLIRPDLITPENETNWLTARVPDLLFYACMMEAMSFVKDAGQIPMWKQMYTDALASQNAQSASRHTDRTSTGNKE